MAAEMKKSMVIELLTFYRNIDGEIRLYKATVADLENYYEPTGGQSMDGQPRAKYNVSSPTENTALNLPESLAGTVRHKDAYAAYLRGFAKSRKKRLEL